MGQELHGAVGRVRGGGWTGLSFVRANRDFVEKGTEISPISGNVNFCVDLRFSFHTTRRPDGSGADRTLLRRPIMGVGVLCALRLDT